MPRLARHEDESFAERLVRHTLQELHVEAVAEFGLGPFIFDFAIPRLRLLLEINSRRWHARPRRQKRDRAKAKAAQASHWELVALPVDARLQVKVVQAVAQRRSLLGMA